MHDTKETAPLATVEAEVKGSSHGDGWLRLTRLDSLEGRREVVKRWRRKMPEDVKGGRE